MSDIKTLTELMKELEEQLVVCMRCGMCQSVCPLFAETGRESDVARGKLALLDGLMQEMFKEPKGVYERLNKCLLCGSCADNCPSGVNVLEIFIRARAILTGYMGLPAVKKAILRGMLARPELFDRLVEWGTKFQKFFTKPVNDLIGTSCARFAFPLIGDRHFMPLTPVPFHQITPYLNTAPGGRSGLKVGFYVGCLMDKIFPNIARAIVDVLDYHGVGIFMPEDQGCCGIPAVSSGDMKTFNQLVRHNVEKFEKESFDYLITACATCTSTIKKIWPMMVQDDSRNIRVKVKAIAEKTLDINQFLVSKTGVEEGTPGKDDRAVRVTYHDPCHLKKSLGISDEPRTVVQANPGYRLAEMPEPDRCCGLGGSFNIQYYDISTEIGKRKRDNIASTGCSVVATGCPACMIQLSDVLSKAGDRVMVKHPVEIYADGLKS